MTEGAHISNYKYFTYCCYFYRWTIEMDLHTDGTGTTTDSGGDQTDTEDLKKERDAYMISMIVFVVLFVATAGLASYLFIKNR